MLTCATPGARQVEAERAHAREAAAASRGRRLRSRAPPRVVPRRLTLKAISGRRAPTSTPPAALVEPGRPEVGRELAGVDAPLQLLGPAAAEERRPAARRRARRRGTPAARARRRPARRARARGRARAPRSSGTIGTSGTTSAAPIRGCAPSCRRRSIRSRARAIAGEQRLDQLAPPSPTSVNTDRLWSGSAWTSSSRAPRRERAPRSPRSSPGRAPPRSSGPTRAAAARAYSRKP